jgi:hypothetical protein
MQGQRKNIENIGLLSSSEDAAETRAPVFLQLVNVFTKADILVGGTPDEEADCKERR